MFLALILALVILNWPVATFAQENCVSVNGEGSICGNSAERKPFSTASGMVNPVMGGGILLIISGGINKLSRKLKKLN